MSAQKIILTRYSDGLELDSTEGVAALDIRFSGNIDGELLGNHIIGVNRGRMIIVFLGRPNNRFMDATGDFRIKKAEVYFVDSPKIIAALQLQSDEVQSIKTVWDTSDG